MSRMRSLVSASVLSGIAALGLGTSTARAQAPAAVSRVPAAPGYVTTPAAGYFYGPGYVGTGYYYGTRPAYPTYNGGYYSNTLGAGSYRDWSTGRTNLPLSKPWLRPIR